MKELSLHITDIIQNSIEAEATFISIEIIEDTEKNIMEISVEDNGKGMEKEFLKKVTDPFATKRTTRKVGLGIPLFKNAAVLSGGDFEVLSDVGVGTKVKATFVHNHIDRQPLGDIKGTLINAIISHENVDFSYRHIFNGKEFLFKTKEIKEALNGISFLEADVYKWIKGCLDEGEKDILN